MDPDRAWEVWLEKKLEELMENCKHDWDVVGYAGFKEEGSRIYLYQCKRCKAVKFDTDTEVI